MWACVRSTSLSLTFDEVDSTCRGSGSFKTSSPTLANLVVSGDAIKEKDDSSFVAMELAARNRTPIDLLVLDGDRTAVAPNQADGWRLTGQILSWVEGQDLADVVKVDFEIKPARSSNNPIAVTGPL